MAQIGKAPSDHTLILHGARAEEGACPEASKPWVLAAAVVGSSMAFIDGTVVNVALPAIQADLLATAFQAQWVVESYALLLAALLLVGGALGDHYGRRRIFAIGVGIFALSSVACGLAANVQQLDRRARGAGHRRCAAGAGQPRAHQRGLSREGARQGHRHLVGLQRHHRGRGAGAGRFPGRSLLVDLGFSHQRADGTAGAVDRLAPRAREPRRIGQRRGSTCGRALLATVGLGGIVYAFIEAPDAGLGFAGRARGAGHRRAGQRGLRRSRAQVRTPMLPLGLLRIGNFSGANLLTLLLYAALGGGLYFFPLNLIQVQGYSATVAGAALLPFILIMFALSGWAGQLVDRFGPRMPLVIGPVDRGGGLRAVRAAGRRGELLERLSSRRWWCWASA